MMPLCTTTPSPLKNRSSNEKSSSGGQFQKYINFKQIPVSLGRGIEKQTYGIVESRMQKNQSSFFSKNQGLSTPPVGVTTLIP